MKPQSTIPSPFYLLSSIFYLLSSILYPLSSIFPRPSTLVPRPSSILYLLFSLLYLLSPPSLHAGNPLPRATPESQGVSSQGIIDFFNAIPATKSKVHSFMLVRHGKVVAEAWWNPYKPEYRNTLYSLSKSFTSTAIGFAVSEGKLTVNDKVLSFFPEYKPAEVSTHLAEMRIKDLLTMSAGQDPESTWKIILNDSNWSQSFLQFPVANQPGTKFLYNSLATYMLSSIIQKVTGQKVVDYLKPRLFDPLGIEGMDWETDPMGINTGGWGLRVKTEDIANFGQFLLQKGMWNGKQLLPVSWIEEATTAKIEQEPNATPSKKDSSDWLQGYCYQFWRCRHHAFRGDGAYGQFMVVMPDQDAVVVITSESNDLQEELNLVWTHLLPAMQQNPLPASEKLSNELTEKIATLTVPFPNISVQPKENRSNFKQTYHIKSNAKGIDAFRYELSPEQCSMQVTIHGVDYPFSFSFSTWKNGSTNLIGPDLFYDTKHHLAEFAPYKVTGKAVWIDENTLKLVLYYIESPHNVTYTCRFKGKKVYIEMQPSNQGVDKRVELKGRAF